MKEGPIMKSAANGARRSSLQVIVPPQPVAPPQPALSPRPAMPAWMDAWLDVEPSTLLRSAPQAILETSTPSFMYQEQRSVVCH
jgi:hypothetical protein